MVVILRGAVERQRREVRLQEGLIYSLASLITTGHHAPKKFPKFDKAFPSGAAKKPQTPEQMLAAMRLFAAPKRRG